MKRYITLLLLVFMPAFVMADTLSQSDFYGTWKVTDNTGTLVCIISKDTWAIKFDDESLTVNILKWEKVDNSSIKTFQIFPSGFRITIQQLDEGIASIILYIDSAKKHIIMPEFSGDIILTKQ